MTKLSEKNSKSGISPVVLSLFFLIVFSFWLSSCSKEPGQIGYIIQPEDSKLNISFSDTSTIYGYSKVVDSIRTDKLSVSAFGSLRDPIFGGTTAGFYTQFILSVNGHDFGEERQLDSLVFQLSFAGSYGDTNVTLTAHTYEMLEGLHQDSIYFSNLQVPIDPTDYSNFPFVPRPHDSIIVQGDTIPPMLWLNLTDISNNLGNKLLNATVDEMEDSEIFQEYFNGLFIQSQPVYDDGAIVYFSLSSANTKLSLYYSNSVQDSLRYDYYITTTTATVNKYEHEYNIASPDFIAQVIHGDTSLGTQKFYAQGYSGVQAIVKIPHIKKWARLGNVAINEAKLVLPGYPGDEFFNAPGQMYLLEIGEDGAEIPLIDQIDGEHYFGGIYNESQNVYEFRITRYIQSLISDTTLPNRGLNLFLFGGSVHPERFIFKGNHLEGDTTSGIKLELLYTDL
ncbi:MAG: DUF4270 family protein [Bacteroidetes bacterium]|nr:DUF4270 family protein [Bacteroidota bacterium]MBL6943355.1 DUF4270 family protein [Bacteroidales bacterium]